MARLFDNTGSERLSAIYHTRVFDRNQKDSEQLYVALTRNIDANREREIKRLGKKFFLEVCPVERNRVIDIVDNYLMQGVTNRNIIALSCPDNELRRAVIRTLLSSGYDFYAREIFEESLRNPNRPSYSILEFTPTDIVEMNYFIVYFANFTIPTGGKAQIRGEFFKEYMPVLFYNRFGVSLV